MSVIKHRDIFLGPWNVRTLYSSGALEILTRELDRTGLDMVALQEVRWPGEGVTEESGKFTLYYVGATKPEFGTGFLVRRNILSAIRDIKFVSDRISYTGKRYDFIIVNVQDDWKTLVQDRDVWRVYVRMAMNLWVR
ncbi:hypothetical protein C0J52_18520 [Blattella germanica]|nr:hypothetical protein C0J52_18520 [Blattella germanica]